MVSWGIRNETRFITQDYNGCIIGCWQIADAFFRWYAQRHDVAICQDGQTRSLKDIIKDVSKTAQWSEQLQNIWEQIHIKGSEAIHNIDIDDEEIAGLTLEQTYEAIVYICTHQYALKGYQYRKFVHPDSQQYLGGNTPKTINNPIQDNSPKTPTATNKQADELLSQAQIHLSKREYLQAQKCLQKAKGIDPNHAEVLFLLAKHYHRAQNTVHRHQVQPLLRQAVALRHARATAFLAEILLQNNPRDPETQNRIWQLLEQTQQYNQDSKQPDNLVYLLYAKIYGEGLLGTEPNLDLAINYAKQAICQGNPQAKKYLTKLQISQTNQGGQHWQWWLNLGETWHKLLVGKGLGMDSTFDFLNEEQALPHINNILKLRHLDLKHSQLNDITPLSALTQLEWLNLDDNNISDLSPLTTLTKLHTLRLKSNAISNIEALSKLPNLQWLWLSYNRISDVRPLENLIELKWLALKSNAIEDIIPLLALTQLQRLDLDNNKIKNIRPLRPLVCLEWLDIRDNNITAIEPIAQLTRLQRLDLRGNRVSNIAPLAELHTLEWLYLSHNAISDITPLAGLTKLAGLDLQNNTITNIEPLARLSRLVGLDLRGNQISDITPLAGLNNLTKTGTHLLDNPISPATVQAFFDNLEN